MRHDRGNPAPSARGGGYFTQGAGGARRAGGNGGIAGRLRRVACQGGALGAQAGVMVPLSGRLARGEKAQIAVKAAASATNASGAHPLPSPQNIAPQKAVGAVLEKPAPEAMRVERDGAQVWVKTANHGGRDFGFVWQGREWVRSAWVEERFLGRVAKPRFAEGDEAFPDTGLARWRNGY